MGVLIIVVWSLFAFNAGIHGVQQYRIDKLEAKQSAVHSNLAQKEK